MSSLKRSHLFATVALGCRTNQYEMEAVKTQLRTLGFQEAIDGEVADLCVINTCSVTDGADSSSRHAIRSMQKKHPHAKIVVTGCMVDEKTAHSFGAEVVFVSNVQKEGLVQQLFPEAQIPEFAIDRFDHHTRAFLKVQDGCNSFCSYCVIPFVRGRSRSRPIESIVKEAERLVRNGFKEIVLTGINVGDFDGNNGSRLSELVKAVDAIAGLSRLRISSIDPNEVDEDLLKVICCGEHTCPSMHIVLQSGSNSVLKRMNRKYTKQMFFDTIRSLKEQNENFTFTTDVIVGFPGETEADFLETVEVLEKVQFAKVHIFPYSERPHTRSREFLDKVSPEDISRRKELLHKVAETTSSRLRDSYVGRRMTILTEQPIEGSGSVGHTANFLEVHIPDTVLLPNQLIEVDIVTNCRTGLVGEISHA